MREEAAGDEGAAVAAAGTAASGAPASPVARKRGRSPRNGVHLTSKHGESRHRPRGTSAGTHTGTTHTTSKPERKQPRRGREVSDKPMSSSSRRDDDQTRTMGSSRRSQSARNLMGGSSSSSRVRAENHHHKPMGSSSDQNHHHRRKGPDSMGISSTKHTSTRTPKTTLKKNSRPRPPSSAAAAAAVRTSPSTTTSRPRSSSSSKNSNSLSQLDKDRRRHHKRRGSHRSLMETTTSSSLLQEDADKKKASKVVKRSSSLSAMKKSGGRRRTHSGPDSDAMAPDAPPDATQQRNIDPSSYTEATKAANLHLTTYTSSNPRRGKTSLPATDRRESKRPDSKIIKSAGEAAAGNKEADATDDTTGKNSTRKMDESESPASNKSISKKPPASNRESPQGAFTSRVRHNKTIEHYQGRTNRRMEQRQRIIEQKRKIEQQQLNKLEQYNAEKQALAEQKEEEQKKQAEMLALETKIKAKIQQEEEARKKAKAIMPHELFTKAIKTGAAKILSKAAPVLQKHQHQSPPRPQGNAAVVDAKDVRQPQTSQQTKESPSSSSSGHPMITSPSENPNHSPIKNATTTTNIANSKESFLEARAAVGKAIGKSRKVLHKGLKGLNKATSTASTSDTTKNKPQEVLDAPQTPAAAARPSITRMTAFERNSIQFTPSQSQRTARRRYSEPTSVNPDIDEEESDRSKSFCQSLHSSDGNLSDHVEIFHAIDQGVLLGPPPLSPSGHDTVNELQQLRPPRNHSKTPARNNKSYEMSFSDLLTNSPFASPQPPSNQKKVALKSLLGGSSTTLLEQDGEGEDSFRLDHDVNDLSDRFVNVTSKAPAAAPTFAEHNDDTVTASSPASLLPVAENQDDTSAAAPSPSLLQAPTFAGQDTSPASAAASAPQRTGATTSLDPCGPKKKNENEPKQQMLQDLSPKDVAMTSNDGLDTFMKAPVTTTTHQQDIMLPTEDAAPSPSAGHKLKKKPSSPRKRYSKPTTKTSPAQLPPPPLFKQRSLTSMNARSAGRGQGRGRGQMSQLQQFMSHSLTNLRDYGGSHNRRRYQEIDKGTFDDKSNSSASSSKSKSSCQDSTLWLQSGSLPSSRECRQSQSRSEASYDAIKRLSQLLHNKGSQASDSLPQFSVVLSDDQAPSAMVATETLVAQQPPEDSRRHDTNKKVLRVAAAGKTSKTMQRRRRPSPMPTTGKNPAASPKQIPEEIDWSDIARFSINSQSLGVTAEDYLQVVVDSLAFPSKTSEPGQASSSSAEVHPSKGTDDGMVESNHSKLAVEEDEAVVAHIERVVSRFSDRLAAEQVLSVQEDFCKQFDQLSSEEQNILLAKIRTVSMVGAAQFDWENHTGPPQQAAGGSCSSSSYSSGSQRARHVQTKSEQAQECDGERLSSEYSKNSQSDESTHGRIGMGLTQRSHSWSGHKIRKQDSLASLFSMASLYCSSQEDELDTNGARGQDTSEIEMVSFLSGLGPFAHSTLVALNLQFRCNTDGRESRLKT
jgi:hypothetical protein